MGVGRQAGGIVHGMSAVSVDCKLVVGSGLSASLGARVPTGETVDEIVSVEGSGLVGVTVGEAVPLWTEAIME